MTDVAALKAANAARWAKAKLTRDFSSVAKRLAAPAAKARYQAVSAKTGVPWPFIAVAHERESSQNWAGSLAQGDRWNKVSTHVPAGRGPFKSWEDAAIDALVNCAPRAALNKDWSIGGTLTMLEQYNGLGYANKGRPSPYVWSGTDQYVSGKYVRDGVYDPNAVDKQLGCAGLLLAMMSLDPSISFDGNHAPAPPPPAPTVPPPKPSTPSVTNPAPGSLGDFIASILSAIFGKKK
jgi:lysozyme family protein